MTQVTRRELMPGVWLRAIHTDKFKSSYLGLTMMAPLEWETAAANALIPAVLRRGTAAHPDLEALSAALDELYGGAIEPVVRKKGETQCIGFVASFLDDAYALEGESILEPAAALLGELLLSPRTVGEGFLPDYVRQEQSNLIDRIRAQVDDKRRYASARLCQLVEEHMDVSQGKLALGFRTGGLTCWEEEYPALVMCNAIFGGTPLSKLFLNVREKLSLCYYASSMLEKMKGLVLVSSGIEFDKYQQARDEILAQLEAIRRGEIEDWELEGARRALISGHLSTLDDQGRLEEFWLGQAAAGLDTGVEELAERFASITREQVAAAAQRLELDTVYFLKGQED